MHRILKRLGAKKEQRQRYELLISQLEIVRLRTDVFTLIAQNTGYAWQGIKTASISLFPDAWVELPHYYSNSLLSDEQHVLLGKKIAELDFSQLIFNGFAPHFARIAETAKAFNPKLKIKLIHHGFLAELAQNELLQNSFKSIIELRQKGLFNELGFVKKGLAQTVNKMYGFDSREIILLNPAKIEQEKYNQNLNIGVMVNNAFRKNLHNMVAAALLKDDATVHVTNKQELMFWPQHQRIVAHGLLEHKQFLSLLGKMTINLHVTFSEASGGQVCSESISQGVPCLSAYTSSFFDYDEYLKEKLIVRQFDDSWHIYKKIDKVLLDYDTISDQCLKYSRQINEMAINRLTDFVNL